VGSEKFFETAKKYSNDMVINGEILQQIMNDPKINDILGKNFTVIDRQLLDLSLLGKIDVDNTSVKVSVENLKENSNLLDEDEIMHLSNTTDEKYKDALGRYPGK
jgi:alpha-D-ribose 1-methylphosphonate 5-triphosphate synthase subunit PhnI